MLLQTQDGTKERRNNGTMDGQTDTPLHRDARMHLETALEEILSHIYTNYLNTKISYI